MPIARRPAPASRPPRPSLSAREPAPFARGAHRPRTDDAAAQVRDSGKVLLAALNKLAEEAATVKPKPEPPQLRPLPFLIYMADGDTAPGSFNVFSQGSELKGAQRVFKRFPETECAPPPEIVAELGDLGQSVQMQLAVVLQRCPHYTTNMAGRWGGASAEGAGTCCVIS